MGTPALKNEVMRDQESSARHRSPDRVTAYTILRLSFGANIMLHGVSRLLAGNAAFLAYLRHYFEHTPGIPASFLPIFAGVLLLIGLATRFSLIAGGLVMAALVVGTNLAQDWNVAGLQLIYCFIYYYLLAHRDLNKFSVDARLGWS
jgi:thiosulfate dehydrogenase [quinone] large subunit